MSVFLISLWMPVGDRDWHPYMITETSRENAIYSSTQNYQPFIQWVLSSVFSLNYSWHVSVTIESHNDQRETANIRNRQNA